MSDVSSARVLRKNISLLKEIKNRPRVNLAVALLTGCQDKSYAFGLAMALAARGMQIDMIGNHRVDMPEFHSTPNVTFLNMGGIERQESGIVRKLFQVLQYYARLIRYITFADTRLLHILWNSKLDYFDRTILTAYCKLLGKRLILTAHNVNRSKRDSTDSFLNRLTLKTQYRLMDRIFVHTEKMKSELVEDFGVAPANIMQIPFGLNIAVPNTTLTSAEARAKLGIGSTEKAILFFGRIAPYKGLEYLLPAFQKAAANQSDYRLIIAGEPMPGHEDYLDKIHQLINQSSARDRILQKLEFIPDADTELYFKAADVLALPYKDIFQSGVLFLGYSFGLPAISADVGSFREDIVPGETGFLFTPGDSASLADALEKFFASDLYRDLSTHRTRIRDNARARHSWENVAELTQTTYEQLLAGQDVVRELRS